MQLFHYHWWTDKVEEMENFYSKLGFEVTLRVGKYNGEMETFNPPLNWEDFREKEITFRIVEMRKGQTNITFGHGKKDMFDHIGFLVHETEYKQIVSRAEKMNWKVNEGERRTFISTPWKIRIELQKRNDVVTDAQDTIIQKMEINLPFDDSPKLIADLLGLKISRDNNREVKMEKQNWSMAFINRNRIDQNLVVYLSEDAFDMVDPVNTKLLTD